MDKTMTQAKFTIESDIVAAFKARCASGGVSMTSAIRQCMKSSCPAKETAFNTSTRPHRRKAVMGMIGLLTDVLDSEAEYRDSIPEQFSQRLDAAEHACSMLEDAIACLEEAF
jgi:hypothetical protein